MEPNTDGCNNFVVTHVRHVIEREPSPSWHFSNVCHEDHYLLALSTKGQCFYDIGGKDYIVEKGDLLFFQKGLLHTAKSNPDNHWSFFSTSFDIYNFDQSIISALEELDNVIKANDYFKFFTLFSELNFLWTAKSTGYMLRCRSIIMEILYIILKEKSSHVHNTPHSRQIFKIMDLIQKNYSHNYSVDELADTAGLSYSHFSFLFKKLTGYTVIEYQNLIKINKAKDLLLGGNCNVTEAADIVGFNNLCYFSRLFRKITGFPPSEYLKR